MKLPDFTNELTFQTSRSGGKGGQHANKAETKVRLEFDVKGSDLLSEKQKESVLDRLDNRINKEGILQITSEEARTQVGNKKIVLDRFYRLIEEAIKPRQKRKKTKPPKSAKKRQKEKEKQHAQKKQKRQKDKDTRRWLREK